MPKYPQSPSHDHQQSIYGQNLNWVFIFTTPHWKKQRKGINAPGQWCTERSKAHPCHVPHPRAALHRQELVPIHTSGNQTTSMQVLKLAQVPGHKQPKNWHFPPECLPCSICSHSLSFGRESLQMPLTQFLLPNLHYSYIFHFTAFQAPPNRWKLQCAKIVGNPHWQFHRSGNPPLFICFHLLELQVFTHLHMKIKQSNYFKYAHSPLGFPGDVKTPLYFMKKYDIKLWIGASISQ